MSETPTRHIRFPAKACIAAIPLFLVCATLFGQQPYQRLSVLEAGYLVGGSGDGFFFSLDHGLGVSVAHGMQINGFTLLGGAGYNRFQRSSFVPVFVSASTRLGKKERGNFRLNMGYAFAHGSGPAHADEYRLRGGWLAEAAYGLNMFRTTGGRLTAWLGYRYQQGKLEFVPYNGGRKISDPLHAHFFLLKIGYSFFHLPKAHAPENSNL